MSYHLDELVGYVYKLHNASGFRRGPALKLCSGPVSLTERVTSNEQELQPRSSTTKTKSLTTTILTTRMTKRSFANRLRLHLNQSRNRSTEIFFVTVLLLPEQRSSFCSACFQPLCSMLQRCRSAKLLLTPKRYWPLLFHWDACFQTRCCFRLTSGCCCRCLSGTVSSSTGPSRRWWCRCWRSDRCWEPATKGRPSNCCQSRKRCDCSGRPDWNFNKIGLHREHCYPVSSIHLFREYATFLLPNVHNLSKKGLCCHKIIYPFKKTVKFKDDHRPAWEYLFYLK